MSGSECDISSVICFTMSFFHMDPSLRDGYKWDEASRCFSLHFLYFFTSAFCYYCISHFSVFSCHWHLFYPFQLRVYLSSFSKRGMLSVFKDPEGLLYFMSANVYFWCAVSTTRVNAISKSKHSFTYLGAERSSDTCSVSFHLVDIVRINALDASACLMPLDCHCWRETSNSP